jgi:site-specific DNA-methyltransferase (adenine-specific)
MTPYYDEDGITIYHGDALEVVPNLRFDVVITDPPYGVDYRPSGDYRRIAGDLDDELAAWVVMLDAPRCVFGATHFPHRLPEPGRWVVWDKRVHPNADKMPGAPFEAAWSTFHRFDRFIRVQHGGAVNDDGRKLKRVHPTQKPVRVMRHIIEETPPGLILDPFMGSGTTLVAAMQMGRKAIGVEVDERYCEIAATRLAQGTLDLSA